MCVFASIFAPSLFLHPSFPSLPVHLSLYRPSFCVRSSLLYCALRITSIAALRIRLPHAARVTPSDYLSAYALRYREAYHHSPLSSSTFATFILICTFIPAPISAFPSC
jgi:hypothetical protein